MLCFHFVFASDNPMIYTHIHIYLVFSSVVKIFSKDQVSQTLGIHTNFSTMTTDHLTVLFLKPSIYIAHGVPGSVVSSIPASFPFVLLLVYTLHPRFSTPLCIPYSHKGTLYTYTYKYSDTHVFLSRVGTHLPACIPSHGPD